MNEPDFLFKLEDNKEGLLKIEFNPKQVKWNEKRWKLKQLK